MTKCSWNSLNSTLVLLLRLERGTVWIVCRQAWRCCKDTSSILGSCFAQHSARRAPHTLVILLNSLRCHMLAENCDSQNTTQELNNVTISEESVNMLSSCLIMFSFYSEVNTGRKMRKKADTLCMVTVLWASSLAISKWLNLLVIFKIYHTEFPASLNVLKLNLYL